MSGPQFLLFYLIIGLLTLLIFKYAIRAKENRFPIPKLGLSDPYEIATLRGGINEAIKIAVISLVDRGLLEVADKKFDIEISTKNIEAIDHARRPIEKAILSEKYAKPGSLYTIHHDASTIMAAQEYRESLIERRLLAGKKIRDERRPLFCLTLLLLGGLAFAKISIALERGYHNIWFLVALMCIFFALLIRMYKSEKTSLGARVLTDLEIMFTGLRSRSPWIDAGGETNEAVLVAAVFGVSVLSPLTFPFIKKLYPKPFETTSSSTNCGAGSSCGSGSSCGGSCAGCGGCGS